MKKIYIQPATTIVSIRVKSYMLPPSQIRNTEADKGSENSTVNFGKRRGIFQDDYEEDRSIW